MVVEKYPEFFCCYYNEEDSRTCVCWGYNLACCYKPTCVPNLATTGGKIILAAWILLILFIIFAPYMLKTI